jgi:hypothetical protein
MDHYCAQAPQEPDIVRIIEARENLELLIELLQNSLNSVPLQRLTARAAGSILDALPNNN